MLYGNTITRHAIKILSGGLCASLLTAAAAVNLNAAGQGNLTPPSNIPADVKVPDDAVLFLIGHAFGSQDYVCLPAANGGFAFKLFTPEATLFDDNTQQIITHFFSVNPNPDDHGAVRATWESSHDSSRVWAAATGHATVRQDSIDWVRLEVVGALAGPTGGAKLSARTKFIQRINTIGGNADPTLCASASDVGRSVRSPYTADYLFYSEPTPPQL
jgi:hypothetical protein